MPTKRRQAFKLKRLMVYIVSIIYLSVIYLPIYLPIYQKTDFNEFTLETVGSGEASLKPAGQAG